MTTIHLVRFIPADRNIENTLIGAYPTFDDARAAIVKDCYAYGHHHRRYGEHAEAKAYGIAADDIGRPNVTERWYDIIAYGDNPRTIGAYRVTEWHDGQRVRLTADIDNYPIHIHAGNTGTITIDPTSGIVGILLDTPHDELDEWDNVVYIWDTSGDVDYTDSVATTRRDDCESCHHYRTAYAAGPDALCANCERNTHHTTH